MRRLNRVVIVALSIGLLPISSVSALQVEGPPSDIPLGTCVSRGGGQAWGCGDADKSKTNSNVSTVGTTSASSSSGPVKLYIPYDKILIAPDGQPCIGTGYYEEGAPAPRPAQGPTEMDEGPGNSSSLYSTAPPCPPQLAPNGETELETPAMVARRYWEEKLLPVPRPRISPGRAITGKLAYLETNGETVHAYSNSTVFGPLEILATGEYTIDWGDGTMNGPFRDEGGPWPDGKITHDYLNVGAYDIVVHERWTATWRLGGQSGTLRSLQTSGRIDDFPVEQIQAVIGR